jgi:prolipoprotein diacylglyceryltransferase
MYPTISHLIYDLFGVKIPLPIQTFGFWVAVSFIVSAWVIAKELKRKELEGKIFPVKIKNIVGKKLSNLEILSGIIFGFFIGFKGFEALTHYSELVENPQQFILSSRGSIMGGILISLLSVFLRWKENKKTRLENPKEEEKIVHPYELMGNMTLIAAISGILGAKIFHNLENFDDFIADPISQLFSFTGLTFYGGLITGAIAVIIYARKYKINIKHLVDCFAPGLILAYGIGRIGCHMSGDGDWGVENVKPKPEWMNIFPDWIWSYNYPNNVLTYNENQGSVVFGKMSEIPNCSGTFFDPYCYQLTNPVYPTPIYEVIMSLLIFALLWKIRKKITIPGCLFFIYLIFNGLERFLIEKIRVNNEYDILGGITQAEIISFILIITGISAVFYLFFSNKSKKNKPT